MNMRENTAFLLWWSKWSRAILAFTWFLGLLSGLGLFLSSGESFCWLIHQAVRAKTSFAMLCGTLLLPFLFSVIAVYLSKPLFLLIVCFFKAALLMFVSSGVYYFYGSAGWLVRILLMFSSISFAPVLYLFWHRYVSGHNVFIFRNSVGFLLLAFVLVGIDYSIIIPTVISF